MIRVVLSSAMAIHGIIHLLGFVKEWNLGSAGKFTGNASIRFSGNTSKVIGSLWFVAFALLLISAIGYYSRKDWFWIVGVAGLFVSQALIVIYWQDAKWGTAINVILVIVVIFSAARIGFNKMVKNEVETLIKSATAEQSVISEEEVSTLPPIIQTWLRKSRVVGKTIPQSIHIIQKGSMRTNPDSKWMPFDAEQYFTIDPPGFVWNASIHTDKFVDIVGRDKYENGKGNMLIKAESLIPMANSSGNEIDQGTMIRYMAEICWFPHAAISRYLTWEQIDKHRARVTMNYNNVTASGIYTFNSDHLPLGFEAERFGEFNGRYSKETWSVATTRFNDFNGMTIGNESEVTWKLKAGDFTWLKLEILSNEYR
jgi:hypothetical protein